jgi:hypothetical protein
VAPLHYLLSELTLIYMYKLQHSATKNSEHVPQSYSFKKCQNRNSPTDHNVYVTWLLSLVNMLRTRHKESIGRGFSKFSACLHTKIQFRIPTVHRFMYYCKLLRVCHFVWERAYINILHE